MSTPNLEFFLWVLLGSGWTAKGVERKGTLRNFSEFLVGKRPNTIIIQGGRSQVSRRLSDGRIVVRNRDDAMTPRIETEEERFNRLYEAPQRRAESTPPPRPPKRIYIRRK